MIKDGDEQASGSMELGKASAEPFGRHGELKTYRDAFKSSVTGLSSSVSETSPGSLLPGTFVDTDRWNSIGIIPHTFSVSGSENISLHTGESFETMVLQSDLEQQNKIWVTDGFPFPVKAQVYLDRVCDLGCPTEYKFELLDYSENMTYDSFLERDSHPNIEHTSPLKQFKSGIVFHETACKPELQLTQKHDGRPACVKPDTIFELIKRNWTSDIIKAVQSRDVSSDIKNATSSYMGKITPTLDDFKNTLSEPYNVDTIFAKFGEPHDNIGSGIHIYVYKLNDLTEIWVGHSDDILYVKHVDSDGIEPENLLAKKIESKTAYEYDFDLPEVKLFLEKYPQAGIMSDHVQYEIHTKHYMYTDSYTGDSVNLVLTKHVTTENMKSILSCHLDQNHNKIYGMMGREKIIGYLQNHDCLSESNIVNLEPLTIRESFLEIGFGDEAITVFITDMANHSTVSMNLFASSQEWDVIPIGNLVGAHSRLPETSSDDRRGPGTMVSDTVKVGTYIKQNDEKEFWYTIHRSEDQVITIELQDHEYARITFVSDRNHELIEQINKIVDSQK